jgi:UDP-N-acetylglucosamine transferase subunit ALG13
MRIVFGICSWGLGHASRSLPIIRRFIQEGDEVTVVSFGSALDLLRNELGESAFFVGLADYRPPTTLNPKKLALNTFLSAPQYLMAMQREHRYLEKLRMNGKIDAIFSDNRFGFYSVRAPSYFMTHQLRLMNPLFLRSLESGSEIFNRWFLDRCAGVLVPDFRENGLAGRLAHELSVVEEENLSYIGVLSDFKCLPMREDLDVFISVSGFEPQRSAFEQLVLAQLDSLEGNNVVSLGRPAETATRGNSRIQGFSVKAERERLLNRAKIVIARSGYSTLMDLCALQKKGLLIPTPGQTEQEYLATYHMSRENYYCVPERELCIRDQLDSALAFSPPKLQHSVERAVENAVGVVTETTRLD